LALWPTPCRGPGRAAGSGSHQGGLQGRGFQAGFGLPGLWIDPQKGHLIPVPQGLQESTVCQPFQPCAGRPDIGFFERGMRQGFQGDALGALAQEAGGQQQADQAGAKGHEGPTQQSLYVYRDAMANRTTKCDFPRDAGIPEEGS